MTGAAASAARELGVRDPPPAHAYLSDIRSFDCTSVRPVPAPPNSGVLIRVMQYNVDKSLIFIVNIDCTAHLSARMEVFQAGRIVNAHSLIVLSKDFRNTKRRRSIRNPIRNSVCSECDRCFPCGLRISRLNRYWRVLAAERQSKTAHCPSSNYELRDLRHGGRHSSDGQTAQREFCTPRMKER